VLNKSWNIGIFLSGAFLGAAPAAAQFEPTRMQMCSTELDATSGDERKKLLSDCLRRRLEGEKIVERDCKRQVRDTAGDAGTTKEALQKQCVSRALQVGYTELPRRPPPAPKPADTTVMATSLGADAPAKAAPASPATTP
jgi:psiF repeat